MDDRGKTDLYVTPTEAGGVIVVCRDCAPSYYGADLAPHEPNARERDFLRGLHLASGIVCVRCRRVVEV
jgi:hypothetical protein